MYLPKLSNDMAQLKIDHGWRKGGKTILRRKGYTIRDYNYSGKKSWIRGRNRPIFVLGK